MRTSAAASGLHAAAAWRRQAQRQRRSAMAAAAVRKVRRTSREGGGWMRGQLSPRAAARVTNWPGVPTNPTRRGQGTEFAELQASCWAHRCRAGCSLVSASAGCRALLQELSATPRDLTVGARSRKESEEHCGEARCGHVGRERGMMRGFGARGSGRRVRGPVGRAAHALVACVECSMNCWPRIPAIRARAMLRGKNGPAG